MVGKIMTCSKGLLVMAFLLMTAGGLFAQEPPRLSEPFGLSSSNAPVVDQDNPHPRGLRWRNGASAEEEEWELRDFSDFPEEKKEAPPAPPSSIERFFANPAPPLGAAISDESPVVTPRPIKGQRPEGEEEVEDPLAHLMAKPEELEDFEKVQFFQQLEPDQQRYYLSRLTSQRREAFLRLLGKQQRWFADDLQAGEVDRSLVQFGYDFFAADRERFADPLFAPVGPDYVIGPGDRLKIDLWGNIQGSYEVEVGRGGEVILPSVGAVHVWGQTFADAKKTIRRQIEKYFTGFEINVSLGELRSIQVYVVGEVVNPGAFPVSSVSTVLSALHAAGGPTKSGSLRRIELKRKGAEAVPIDLYDFFLFGDKSRDLKLQSGDTLFVPVVGPLVGVAGEVRRPAIYELSGETTLDRVLEMAGGLTATAYLEKVLVERVEVNRKKVVFDMDLSDFSSTAPGQAEQLRLQDRDLIVVSPIKSLSEGYVRLSGYVARGGRYGWSPGMKVSELLKRYDNLLPGYYPEMAEILRFQPPEYRPERITFDLGRALSGDAEHDVTLKQFDEVQIYSRQQMEETPKVTAAGALLRPGDYRLFGQMRVRDLVVAAGNLKRSAYLEKAEITRFVSEGRKSRLERFEIDLARAIAKDPQHNLLLHPKDRLMVHSIPDFDEEMTIVLEGQVRFPGEYAVAKGERLSSVLARAGGFAKNAYLRGAVFTRRSLQDVQRQRLEQLVFKQEQEIFRVSTELAQGALSVEEVKAAEDLLKSRKEIVESLKQAPVLGRMVVQLAPLEEFRNSDYDIELLNGDKLVVPENPQSVSVLGEVYNPTSLAYQAGRSVGHYLSRVGGPTEEANQDRMFIVRADGTVFSKAQAGFGMRWDSDTNRWIVGGFNATELYPGDTVLVPEKVRKIDIMREVKDLSQVFYQMALGAAAVLSF